MRLMPRGWTNAIPGPRCGPRCRTRRRRRRRRWPRAPIGRAAWERVRAARRAAHIFAVLLRRAPTARRLLAAGLPRQVGLGLWTRRKRSERDGAQSRRGVSEVRTNRLYLPSCVGSARGGSSGSISLLKLEGLGVGTGRRASCACLRVLCAVPARPVEPELKKAAA